MVLRKYIYFFNYFKRFYAINDENSVRDRGYLCKIFYIYTHNDQ